MNNDEALLVAASLCMDLFRTHVSTFATDRWQLKCKGRMLPGQMICVAFLGEPLSIVTVPDTSYLRFYAELPSRLSAEYCAV